MGLQGPVTNKVGTRRSGWDGRYLGAGRVRGMTQDPSDPHRLQQPWRGPRRSPRVILPKDAAPCLIANSE